MGPKDYVTQLSGPSNLADRSLSLESSANTPAMSLCRHIDGSTVSFGSANHA